MSISLRLVMVLAVLALPALPVAAQDPAFLSYSTGCAPLPPGEAPSDAPRIIGPQDPLPRTLYGPRDLVVINAGTQRKVQVGQRFYIRRLRTSLYSLGDEPITTTGGLRVVAANEAMAIGQIDLGCDGVHPGDYLEPAPSALPLSASPAADSDLDFTAPSRVLWGDHGKENGGKGDLMIVELRPGAAPGMRYAIYRDLMAGGSGPSRMPRAPRPSRPIFGELVAGVPLAPIGEAVVVSVYEDTAMVRLTQTRDSVKSGDLLIPHRR